MFLNRLLDDVNPFNHPAAPQQQRPGPVRTPPPQQPQRLAWNLVPARPDPTQEPP